MLTETVAASMIVAPLSIVTGDIGQARPTKSAQ